MVWIGLFTSLISDDLMDDRILCALFEVAQAVRILRVINWNSATSMLARVIIRSQPTVVPHAAIILTVVFLYDMMGCAMFAGSQEFEYGKGEYYYLLNFDTPARGLFTLFMLLMQNNWHVATMGFVHTHPDVELWVKLWFVSFNLLVAWIMMNVFVGVLIDTIDMFRRDELKEDTPLKALVTRTQKELRHTNTPSGRPWRDTWEVYTKVTSVEQLLVDFSINQSEEDAEAPVNSLAQAAKATPMGQTIQWHQGLAMSWHAVLTFNKRPQVGYLTALEVQIIGVTAAVLPAAVYGSMDDGTVCFANQSFAALVGLCVSDVLGRLANEVMPHIQVVDLDCSTEHRRTAHGDQVEINGTIWNKHAVCHNFTTIILHIHLTEQLLLESHRISVVL